MSLQDTIQRAFRGDISIGEASAAVTETIDRLDTGRARLAEPAGDGWCVHGWLQEAILLYFRIRGMEVIEHGPFTYHDKIPLKRIDTLRGVRVVPPATVRHGAFVEAGAVLMPCYVNIGARVGAGSMIDTWATIGSGAQIGADVHIAGGAGIGGVLEPPGTMPVIVEDGAFVGSRVIVTEGVRIGREAVIGAGVVLTTSTRIIDASGAEPVEHQGLVPPGSVVIPGTRLRAFPAGDYGVPCALVIGQRNAGTDRKTSLNTALRDFDVPV